MDITQMPKQEFLEMALLSIGAFLLVATAIGLFVFFICLVRARLGDEKHDYLSNLDRLDMSWRVRDDSNKLRVSEHKEKPESSIAKWNRGKQNLP